MGSGDGFKGASSIVTMESKSDVNECNDKNSMQSCTKNKISVMIKARMESDKNALFEVCQ